MHGIGQFVHLLGDEAQPCQGVPDLPLGLDFGAERFGTKRTLFLYAWLVAVVPEP
jgi:hypothetical protein